MSDNCKLLLKKKYDKAYETHKSKIDEIVKDIDEARLIAKDPLELQRLAQDKLNDKFSARALLHKVEQLQTKMKRDSLRTRWSNHPDGSVKGMASVMAETRGSTREGQGISFENMHKARMGEVNSVLDMEIDEVNFNTLTKDSAGVINAAVTGKGSKLQLEAASKLRSVYDYLHKIKADTGLVLGKLDNYLFNQRNMIATKKFYQDFEGPEGKTKYLEFMSAKLDKQKSKFLSDNELTEFLDGYYDQQIAMKNQRTVNDFDPSTVDVDELIGMDGAIKVRNSASRQLFFKDEALAEVFETLSDNTLYQAMRFDSYRAARDAAEYQMFGAGGIKDWYASASREAMALDPQFNEKAAKVLDNPQLIFENMAGNTTMVNADWYNGVQAAKSFVSSITLGKTMVQALALDPVNVATKLYSEQGGFFARQLWDAYSSQFKATYRAFETQFNRKSLLSQIEMAKIHGITVETRSAALFQMANAEADGSSLRKLTAGLSGFFQRFNPASNQNAFARIEYSTMMSGAFGKYVQTPMKDLPEDVSRYFKKYGVTDAEYKVLQASTIKTNDVDMLYSDGIDLVSDDVIRTAIKEQGANKALTISQYRSDLKAKYKTMIYSEASAAMTVPGVAAKARGGSRPQRGTMYGELPEFVTMFKSYPSKFLDNQIANYQSAKTGGRSMQYMGANIFGLMSGGYLSLALYSTVKGESPPDPTNPKTIANVAMRSGVMGVWGAALADSLFSQGYGNSLSATVAGPIVGKADDAVGLLSKGLSSVYSMKDDEFLSNQFSSSDVKKFAGLIPGNNLFYVEPFTEMFGRMSADIVDPSGKARRAREKRLSESEGALWEPEILFD